MQPRFGSAVAAFRGHARRSLQIQGYLSQGATARVYLARDLETEGTVVIKVLSPEAADKPGLRACVEREAKVAARVQHPNVVAVLGDGVTSWGLPYLVMEALDGEPLDAALAAARRISNAIRARDRAAVGAARCARRTRRE